MHTMSFRKQLGQKLTIWCIAGASWSCLLREQSKPRTFFFTEPRQLLLLFPSPIWLPNTDPYHRLSQQQQQPWARQGEWLDRHPVAIIRYAEICQDRRKQPPWHTHTTKRPNGKLVSLPSQQGLTPSSLLTSQFPFVIGFDFFFKKDPGWRKIILFLDPGTIGANKPPPCTFDFPNIPQNRGPRRDIFG